MKNTLVSSGEDVVRIDIASGKIIDFIKFREGCLAMVTGGHSIGRVGVITTREKHQGGVEIVHLRDKLGHSFSTRLSNVFVIGESEDKPWVTLPRGEGIKLSNIEERERLMEKNKK